MAKQLARVRAQFARKQAAEQARADAAAVGAEARAPRPQPQPPAQQQGAPPQQRQQAAPALQPAALKRSFLAAKSLGPAADAAAGPSERGPPAKKQSPGGGCCCCCFCCCRGQVCTYRWGLLLLRSDSAVAALLQLPTRTLSATVRAKGPASSTTRPSSSPRLGEMQPAGNSAAPGPVLEPALPESEPSCRLAPAGKSLPLRPLPTSWAPRPPPLRPTLLRPALGLSTRGPLPLRPLPPRTPLRRLPRPPPLAAPPLAQQPAQSRVSPGVLRSWK